jgi:hypothetical protein
MRRRTKLAFAMLLSSCLFSGIYSRLNAQVNSVQASSEDTKAIEAILHSNPSDHVTEDVSFTNIFGTVRYGRAEFVKRHIEIGNTIFKGTTVKSSIQNWISKLKEDNRLIVHAAANAQRSVDLILGTSFENANADANEELTTEAVATAAAITNAQCQALAA